MTDGRCETCTWWRQHYRESLTPIQGEGSCRRIRVSADGEGKIAWLNDWKEETSPTVFLLTRPDFGCVQWEKRE